VVTGRQVEGAGRALAAIGSFFVNDQE